MLYVISVKTQYKCLRVGLYTRQKSIPFTSEEWFCIGRILESSTEHSLFLNLAYAVCFVNINMVDACIVTRSAKYR